MKIQIPEDAAKIVDTLEMAGFEAYVVGGCVRDALMGRTPHDWDITTAAHPEAVKKLFAHTMDSGIAHGTVTVQMGEEGYEVTTFRLDGEYEDGRHPKEVIFTPLIEEDLKRRDFTVNAMAYSPKRGIVDLFGGIEDLKARRIRCVGDPVKRFSEDALRIMRALRFSAQLGFDIEEKTLEGMREKAENLSLISSERICQELMKLLLSDHPEVLEVGTKTGMTAVFLPELDVCMKTVQNNPHHCYTVGAHILKSVTAVEPDPVLRLTMLLHDIEKPACRTTDTFGIDHFKGHAEASAKKAEIIMERLRIERETANLVKKLILCHDHRPKAKDSEVRRHMNRIGPELYPLYLKICYADLAAQSDYDHDKKLERIRGVEECWRGICERGDCVTLKQLSVNGADLIRAGVKPGRKVGEILNEMLGVVLEDASLNVKETLLKQFLL